MYTEHNQTKKNKKALLLLLVLGVFGFVVFKYTDVKDIVAKDNNSEAATCGTTIIDNSYDYTSKFFIIEDDGDITNVTPEKVSNDNSVLGTNTASSGGCTTQNLSTSDAKCIKSENSFSINGKSFMAADVTITMTSIKAPLVLFSGSGSTQIANSNRNNSGIYKPAGEQYDERQILVNTTPGEDHDAMLAKLDAEPVKTNFGTQYTIATAEAQDSASKGDIVVDKFIDDDCEACKNVSNPNPKKSNDVSKKIADLKFMPPSSSNEAEESEETIEIISECEEYRNMSLLSLINPTVCSNASLAFLGSLSSLFPSHDWNQCNPEEDTGCVSASNLVVKMSPLFKETNRYMGLRNSSAMDPKVGETYTPVYVLTSCRALITNKDTGSSIGVDVKCVWDMSYLFYENAASAYDEDPKTNNIMSDEEYMEYLKNETVTRGSNSLTSM